MPVEKKPEEKDTKTPDNEPDDTGTETEPGAEGGDEGGNEGEKELTPAQMKEELAKIKQHNADLQEEAKKRRLENKTLKDKLKGTGTGTGTGGQEGKGKGKDVDAVEEYKTKADAKLRSALLRGSLASVAPDAHDQQLVLTALGKLEDVDVDIDTDEVDEDTLKDKVDKLREKKPFLFTAKDSKGNPQSLKPGAKLPPDGGGRPKGGGTEAATWNLLKQQGRVEDARAYYQKHRQAIMVQQTSK